MNSKGSHDLVVYSEVNAKTSQFVFCALKMSTRKVRGQVVKELVLILVTVILSEPLEGGRPQSS